MKMPSHIAINGDTEAELNTHSCAVSTPSRLNGPKVDKVSEP